jgi:hypothetical protein
VTTEPNPPGESDHLTILPAREALWGALPLPSRDEMAVDGLTNEEWTAFEAAIASR